MARHNNQYINDNKKDELEELAEQYIEVKEEETKLKKTSDELNKQIKKIMKEREIDYIDTSLGRAKLSPRRSESFDEENLIEFLKTSGNSRGIVKKIEAIDYDALESAIYRGKISEDDVKKMDEYKIVKTTYALTIDKGGRE